MIILTEILRKKAVDSTNTPAICTYENLNPILIDSDENINVDMALPVRNEARPSIVYNMYDDLPPSYTEVTQVILLGQIEANNRVVS